MKYKYRPTGIKIRTDRSHGNGITRAHTGDNVAVEDNDNFGIRQQDQSPVTNKHFAVVWNYGFPFHRDRDLKKHLLKISLK